MIDILVRFICLSVGLFAFYYFLDCIDNKEEELKVKLQSLALTIYFLTISIIT